MMTKHSLIDHGFILTSVAFTVYSQLIMRWQVGSAGELPPGFTDKIEYVVNLLVNPWVFSGIIATFLAGVAWMLAMTRFEISYAYPFVGLNFVLIILLSALLFGEGLSIYKLIGTSLIVAGVAVVAAG